MFKFRHLFVWLTVLPTFAHAFVAPTLEDFRSACRAFRHDAATARLSECPPINQAVYVPNSILMDDQTRFAFPSALSKLEGKAKRKTLFKFDEGRSLYSIEKKPSRGIYYRGKIFLKDGHHRVAVSAYFEAPTMPVIVDEDKSELSPEEFDKYLADNNFSYLKDYQGNIQPRVGLCEMLDDANLELARLLITSTYARKDASGQWEIDKPESNRVVIGIKTDLDISYLEFEIADALRRAGVAWDTARGEEISKDELKRFLKILKEARKVKGSRLQRILLFDKPTAESDIDFKGLVVPHLQKLECEMSIEGRK